MDEKSKNALADLKNSHQHIMTIGGVVICVLLALVAGRDLIFGLVMGTVLSSGMNLGRHVAKQIAANAPADHQLAANIAGIFITAVIVGVITSVVLAAIQGAVDVSPVEGDNIIASIVKSFFDSAAALAVAAGVVAGGWMSGKASD